MQYLTGGKNLIFELMCLSFNFRPGISILQQAMKHKDHRLQGLASGMHVTKGERGVVTIVNL